MVNVDSVVSVMGVDLGNHGLGQLKVRITKQLEAYLRKQGISGLDRKPLSNLIEAIKALADNYKGPTNEAAVLRDYASRMPQYFPTEQKERNRDEHHFV